METIPVICDRCQATGAAGLADFSHLGDLLEFTPVPRQLKRRDGWTPVLQREFIARLAQTGSPTLAVEAMGKCLHGVRKLLKDPGSDSFRAVWERAMELGEGAEARRRIAEQAGILQRSGHLTGPSGRHTAVPDLAAEADGMDEPGKRELIENVMRKHALKVGQEREARLAGEIVAADFYLRQISWFEVAMDLLSGHSAAFRYLHDFRCGEHYLIEIAETPMSRLLDSHRREYWAAEGEPERPEHPPRRYLQDHGDYSLEPLEFEGGEIDREELRRRFEEAHTAEAKAQVLWEQAASIEAREWRKKLEKEKKK